MAKNYVNLSPQNIRALQESEAGKEFLAEYRRAENFIRRAVKIVNYGEDPSRVSIKKSLTSYALPTRMMNEPKRKMTSTEKRGLREETRRMKKINAVLNKYGKASDVPSSVLKRVIRNYGVVMVKRTTPYEEQIVESSIDLRHKYRAAAKKARKAVEVGVEKTPIKLKGGEKESIIEEIIPKSDTINDDRSLKRHTARLNKFGKAYDKSKALMTISSGWSLNNMVANYGKVLNRIADEGGEEGEKIANEFFKTARTHDSFGMDFLLFTKQLKANNESLYEKMWDSEGNEFGGWSNVIRELDKFLSNYR